MSDGICGGCSFNFIVVNFEFCLKDLPKRIFTLVSSQKSAYMPEVARMVLSVKGTNLLSFRVMRL